jgi:ParB-like chromosome segregation protein Spo0J
MSSKRHAGSFGDFDVSGLDVGTLTIAAKKLSVRTGDITQNDLQFFVENPRIHSLLHADGTEPSQEEVQAQLERLEHVKELVHDIRRNDGLIDALIVRSGTREVVEGNSRLAAYRCLAREDPIKWGKIKATLLPEPVESVVIDVLLGQYHLKGKKEWPPYEQAGYLFRRVHNHGFSVDALALELGLGKRRIQQMIDTYAFMVDKKDNHQQRWSYYDEYTKSSQIAKARVRFPALNSVVVKKIRSGEISTAQDLRDKLRVICTSSGKALEKFVAGTLDFDSAYDVAETRGGTHAYYRRLEKFRKWIAEKEVQDGLTECSPQILKRVAFEVRHLRKILMSLEHRLG